MAYYDALVTKWGTLTGTTAQKLAAINAATVTLPAIPMVVPTYKIYNSLVPSEFQALTAGQQQLVRDVFGMGTVDVSSGTNARTVLLNIFGVGTTTRANLVALAAPYDSPTVPWWQATVAQGGGGLSSPVNANDLVAAGNLT